MINWPQEIRTGIEEANEEGSHTERDTHTFHPSQIANCKRQATISKLGLSNHTTETLGNFLAGTLFHEWVEENLDLGDSVVHEVSCGLENDGIKFTGHADIWDVEEGILYDIKTRGDYFHGGFQYLDPPNDRHITQLSVYMRCLEVSEAQVIYVDKKNPTHIQTWPEGDTFDLTHERYMEPIRKAKQIKEELEAFESEHGHLPEKKSEVPFEKDDCWVCENE